MKYRPKQKNYSVWHKKKDVKVSCNVRVGKTGATQLRPSKPSKDLVSR